MFFNFWQDLGFGECSFLFEFFCKKSGKLEFFSFWQDLGFGECLFLFKFYLQEYWKVDFCSFWQVLGFGEFFFYSNSNLKNIENLSFSAFGKILALANAFSIQIQIETDLKRYWQVHLCSFWQDLGFDECFFMRYLLTSFCPKKCCQTRIGKYMKLYCMYFFHILFYV